MRRKSLSGERDGRVGQCFVGGGITNSKDALKSHIIS